MYWMCDWDMTDSFQEIENEIKPLVNTVLDGSKKEVTQALKLIHFFDDVISKENDFDLTELIAKMQTFYALESQIMTEIVAPWAKDIGIENLFEAETRNWLLLEALINEYYLMNGTDVEKVCVYLYILNAKLIMDGDMLIWADTYLTQMLGEYLERNFPEAEWEKNI